MGLSQNVVLLFPLSTIQRHPRKKYTYTCCSCVSKNSCQAIAGAPAPVFHLCKGRLQRMNQDARDNESSQKDCHRVNAKDCAHTKASAREGIAAASSPWGNTSLTRPKKWNGVCAVKPDYFMIRECVQMCGPCFNSCTQALGHEW